MTADIQQLSDDQLDSIVGGSGTPLPAICDKYINSYGGIRIGHVSSSGMSSSKSMAANKETVFNYLGRLESRGVTEIKIFHGAGTSADTMSIGAFKAMMG